MLRALRFKYMTLTEQKLRESIYQENLRKMVSILYDRFYGSPDEFTTDELESLEYAARISDSKFLTSIEREIEKRK